MAQLKSKAGSSSVSQSVKNEVKSSELLFGKKNYLYLGVGIILICIGFLLMSGGSMPSPDVWDENIIYSFRRITLAPIVILVGLIVSGMSIFVKK
jgi:hypothetical protein